MKRGLLVILTMLWATMSGFTQEPTISKWAYGLETSYGLSSGYSSESYSFSFQAMSPSEGWSIDWIHRNQDENSSGLMAGKTGILGSLFVGLPMGNVFGIYAGGGLGLGIADDYFFAWKLDGGAMAWLFNLFYVKAGVTYDNIRELGISASVGFKLEKYVTATYRDYNGTFRRTFTKNLWENNSTPNYVYEDKLDSSEIVRRYQKNTTTSSYTPAQYEFKTSGGETYNTTLKDRYGNTIATSTTTTPTRSEHVKTADAEITTRTYLWNVTVTRHWYTQTCFYKDRAPTTTRFYRDTESAVLVNSFSETERR